MFVSCVSVDYEFVFSILLFNNYNNHEHEHGHNNKLKYDNLANNGLQHARVERRLSGAGESLWLQRRRDQEDGGSRH